MVFFERKLETNAFNLQIVRNSQMFFLCRSLTQGGITEEESHKAAAASMKLSTDTFTAEKAAMAVEQKKQTRLAQGGTIINSEKRTAAASQSKLTFKNLPSLPCPNSNGKCVNR